MSVDEVDAYLAQLDEPKRSTLQHVRRSIASVIPEAEEGLSYGVPVFRIAGKPGSWIPGCEELAQLLAAQRRDPLDHVG